MMLIGAVMAMAAAQASECWGVTKFPDKHLVFIDAEAGHYIEYRQAERFKPLLNPMDYTIQYRFLLQHDIATDAVAGSAVTVEMIDRDGEVAIPPDEAEQLMSVAMVTGTSLGPAFKTDRDWVPLRAAPQPHQYASLFGDPPAGIGVVFSHMRDGGTVQLRYTQKLDGNTMLAELRTAFPANPKHQAESRAEARRVAESWAAGRCPFEHDD
jgi:hypothetical protein